MKRLLLLLAIAMAAVSCDDTEFKTGFISYDGIRLEIGGETVFEYDPLTCQLGYNSKKGEFRVHNDEMSEFFSVTLPHLPSVEEEFVTGDISWTTETDVVTKKKVTLETLKIEGDMIWLWNRGSRIAVTVRILY